MILETIGSLVVDAIGAVIGWGLTEFAARPIRRFFDLRGEVIRRMAQYADIPAQIVEKGGAVETPAVTEADVVRAKEAESVIRDLATQMLSLAKNEPLAGPLLKMFRYDLHEAATGLFAVSYLTPTSGRLKDKPKEMVAKALRIDKWLLF